MEEVIVGQLELGDEIFKGNTKWYESWHKGLFMI